MKKNKIGKIISYIGIGIGCLVTVAGIMYVLIKSLITAYSLDITMFWITIALIIVVAWAIGGIIYLMSQ